MQDEGPRTHDIALEEGHKVRDESDLLLIENCLTFACSSPFRVLTAGKMKVRRDDRLRLEGTDLQISRIERDDAGEYICEVETDDDEPIAIVHSVEILGECYKLGAQFRGACCELDM